MNIHSEREIKEDVEIQKQHLEKRSDTYPKTETNDSTVKEPVTPAMQKTCRLL